MHYGRCSSDVMPIKMALKQKGVHFVLCRKQSNKIEGVVINRVCILGILLIDIKSCPFFSCVYYYAYCWFSVSHHSKYIKIKIKTVQETKSGIWEMKGGKHTKTLAKIQDRRIFRIRDMRRNVLPKFIEICMQTPCWCPPGWAPKWRTETNKNICYRVLVQNRGRDPFNQNSDRSDQEKWTTSKGGPVFPKLFRLDRTDPLSLGPKFPEILVEWIAPRKFIPRGTHKH